MKNRFLFFIMSIVLLFYLRNTTFACNEGQTNIYVPQILFGESAMGKSSDNNVKLLLDALYLCSEQSDNLGKEKIYHLKSADVRGIPALSEIDIKAGQLMEYSHNSWEYEFVTSKEKQDKRRKILQNTVNKVFDISINDNWFGSNKGKCISFAAMMYYSHILADYLADDPAETETNIDGKLTPAYSGQPYSTINGNKPSFSKAEKNSTISFINFSSLDSQNRAQAVFGNIGPDTIAAVRSRQYIGNITPSGWHLNKSEYSGIVNSSPPYLYNRCHLLAHKLGGVDQEINLVTGTRYMNETGMLPFESKVIAYIKESGNHVLYRATPIYKGDNKLCSGVQLEAYSVEDSGAGISFNVYCYNVQPGVDINYESGDNNVSDTTIEAKNILPFAVNNASESKPDLIYEMNKHLGILFSDQKESGTYISMINEINSVANEARSVGGSEENEAKIYITMKEYEYKYFDALKRYIPLLLDKEDFFNSVFH